MSEDEAGFFLSLVEWPCNNSCIFRYLLPDTSTAGKVGWSGLALGRDALRAISRAGGALLTTK